MAGTYSPCRMSILVAGKRITGFSEDDMLSVTRDTNNFTKAIGVTGEVARAKHCNTAGKIVLTLLQTSADNDFLSSLANADHASGKGQVPIFIEDLDGSSKFASLEAWVEKMPDGEFGAAVGSRVWSFDCADLSIHHGGASSSSAGAVGSILSSLA